MAVYINQPMFPVDTLRPTRARFDNIGSAIEGGANGMGEALSVETSGGGTVTASYEGLMLEGPDERYEILNWLGARLNGGFRFINVPIVNDKIGPWNIPLFGSNGAMLAGAADPATSVYGQMTASAALNAGVISLQVVGPARDLRWSDWFSINHPTKGWRAYRYWDVVSKSGSNYSLAISPPLREAVPAGTRVELVRPRCVMKLQRGSTVPFEYEGWYSSRPSINFVEAF
jgi:hypothetical protein